MVVADYDREFRGVDVTHGTRGYWPVATAARHKLAPPALLT
jgi:hypothetical protein